jgi:hypothetical protein
MRSSSSRGDDTIGPDSGVDVTGVLPTPGTDDTRRSDEMRIGLTAAAAGLGMIGVSTWVQREGAPDRLGGPARNEPALAGDAVGPCDQDCVRGIAAGDGGSEGSFASDAGTSTRMPAEYARSIRCWDARSPLCKCEPLGKNQI